MTPLAIGWDVETCPQPYDALSPAQRRRHDLLLAEQLARTPAMHPDEASRRVRSLHPMLGWICCIAVARYADGRIHPPRSFTAATPEDEPALLRAFWDALAQMPRYARFVTFNGKRFDADWLRVRSAAHGIAPTRRDILDTYPFRHEPHADLARVFGCAAGLADLCDLLGVPNPKSDMDGGAVSSAVAAGRLADVATYCEADVVATLECYQRLTPQM